MSQGLLRQLGELPGVVGSLLAGRDGYVHEHAFPAIFERRALEGLASSLARESRLGVWMTQVDAALDLRFPDGRVLVRPAGDALLLVLCTSQVDAQLLQLAMTQAIRRVQRTPAPEDQASAEPWPTSSPSPLPVAEAPATSSPVQAMAELLEASLGDRAGPAVACLRAGQGSPRALLQAVEDLAPLVREAIGSDRAVQVQYLLRAIVDQDVLPGGRLAER